MTMEFPKNFITPAKLVRQKEPYHFQRWRASAHSSYPRPAQPNTFQPNALTRPKATKQSEYWKEVEATYLERRKYRPLEQNL